MSVVRPSLRWSAMTSRVMVIRWGGYPEGPHTSANDKSVVTNPNKGNPVLTRSPTRLSLQAHHVFRTSVGQQWGRFSG